ncbi:MAG: 4Fe-4S binding protein [Helicobacteraceae bacterium]|jgi:pyruvate ferredoxin oxidoreductase delta subunit|nr:4Fe-4S binding protein [Helicobacteraceae bacterium]
MVHDENALLGWSDFEAGAILFSYKGDRANNEFHENNSIMHSVADWRVVKPIFNPAGCIHCQFCWVACPDSAIIAKDKKFDHIDYDHCKGCGICADQCPTNPKSLVMFPDLTKENEALKMWPAKEAKKEQ